MLTKKSFTLMEILAVIVITGLLSAIGMVTYGNIKEKAANQEAKSSLLLIQVAERSYKMENAAFYPSAGNVTNIANRSAINTTLRLSLPVNPLWTITIYSAGYAEATRSGRTWRIDFPAGSSETPTCSPCVLNSPTCPCP